MIEVTTRAVHDGNGGAICAWEDLRSGDEGDIYAQHVSSTGAVLYPTLNVTNMLNGQNGITADGDGNGNMLLAWNDKRLDDNIDVWAAKISAVGSLHVEWTTQVVSAPAEQTSAKLCPDGLGGCYISWVDKRSGGFTPEDVYVQRLNGSGQPQWQVDGIPVCTLEFKQDQPRVAVSMNGGSQDGLIMVWADYREDNFNSEVYCQKYSSTGTALWQQNGFLVCDNATPTDPKGREHPRLTSDLNGGAFVSWEDLRDVELITECDLYLARVLANGTQGCGDCGVLVAADENAQDQPLLRVDEGANVTVFWDDWRSGSQSLRYQQFSFEGCVGGIYSELVAGLDGNADIPRIVTMAPGKVGVVWEDNRHFTGGTALFYQVVDTTGEHMLVQNGDYLAPDNTGAEDFQQKKHQLCPDGANGFFCVWEDLRAIWNLIRIGHVNSNGQRVDTESGVIIWEDLVSPGDQGYAFVTPDGQGGCYVAWSGYNLDFWLDVRVMRMSPQLERMWNQPVRLTNTQVDDFVRGLVTNPDGSCALTWVSGSADVPFDIMAARVGLNGDTATWNFRVCDAPFDQDNSAIVADGVGGVYVAWSDLRNGATFRDIYAQHIQANGQISWQENGIRLIDAPQHQNNPVLQIDSERNLYVLWDDYRSGEELDIYAQKVTPSGTLLWPASGKVICSAVGLQQEQVAHVEWNDGMYAAWADNREYYQDVYATHLTSDGQTVQTPDNYWHPDSGGVVISFYQHQNQPVLADDGHGGVVAVWKDFRASGKDPLWNVWGQWLNDYTVSVREIPSAGIPDAHELSQNYPNPFNPATEIRFALPRTERVEVAVFNTLGQQVATLVNEVMNAGSYSIHFEANTLPSGTYFYRLNTPTFQTVRKMVLLR